MNSSQLDVKTGQHPMGQLEENMALSECQQGINELQAVIDDTQHTLDRFEATGMDEQMPEDYEALLAIPDGAVKQQRKHTLAMLDSTGTA